MKNRCMVGFLLFAVLVTLALPACTTGGGAQAARQTTALAAVEPATLPVRATSTPLSSATATITPEPSSTATPSATPTALFAMSIAAERARSYPGSEITLEQELEPGANYQRYYASYLSDGLRIYGLLTVPNGDPPPGGWPAILFNHGYIAPEVYVTTERYVAYVDTLAQNGYIVFKIDYRGNDRSQGEPTGAYGDPGYTDDVLNALAAVQQFPAANPEKIGMWGHSMGGFLTLRAMVISKEIKAGVIWGGVIGSYPDLMTLWRRNYPGPTPTPPARHRSFRQWTNLFGTPEQNPSFWQSVSANSYLGDISGPLQLQHATTDEEVPLIFSQIVYEQMQALGKPVELYTYEGDNHNIAANFSVAMARTVAFFDAYLK